MLRAPIHHAVSELQVRTGSSTEATKWAHCNEARSGELVPGSMQGPLNNSWNPTSCFLGASEAKIEASTLMNQLDANSFVLPLPPPPLSPIFMPDALLATTLPIYPALEQALS